MSKEREYQVGDIVECTNLFYGDEDCFTVGKHYRVAWVGLRGDVSIIADTGWEYLLSPDQIKLVTAVEGESKTLIKPELEKITIAGKDYKVTAEVLSEIMGKLK